MVCDLCKENEAVIFLEAIGKNGKRKINLCTQCAMARGIQAPVSAPNSENLAAVFKEIEEKEELRDSNSKKLCPICGKSLYSILKYCTAGCPECYEIFKSDIQKVLQEHGISGVYTGSMPKRLASFRNSLTKSFIQKPIKSSRTIHARFLKKLRIFVYDIFCIIVSSAK